MLYKPRSGEHRIQHKMEPNNISVVIAARNESAQIAACIHNVRGWCKEVIVVDDYSSDDTVSIATECGAKVVSLSEQGFPRTGINPRVENVFKVGFQEAASTYILRLDVDERPSRELLQLFAEASIAGEFAAVRVARRYYFFGDWLRHGGWFRSQQVALFRADSWDRGWPTGIHQQVQVEGLTLTVDPSETLSIAHYDYEYIQEFVQRSLITYAMQDGTERVSRTQGSYRPSIFWRPFKVGFGRFILRKGYRDGVRGAVVAGLLAAYELCSECYAWNISRQKSLSGDHWS